MQSPIACGMNRDDLRRELAKALAPGFGLKCNDGAVWLDTNLVDCRHATPLPVEHDNVCSIQMCHCNHGWPLSRAYAVCHTHEKTLPGVRARSSETRIEEVRRLIFSAVISEWQITNRSHQRRPCIFAACRSM